VLEIFTAWKLLVNNISHKFKILPPIKHKRHVQESELPAEFCSMCQNSYVRIFTPEIRQEYNELETLTFLLQHADWLVKL
jgi:hypothetical protein